MASYRDLKVWQVGVELSIELYGLTRAYPDDEKYGLTSQLRRAGVSVPSNIAEGHGRGSKAELIRYLGIAKGSLAEIETQLIVAERLGYCSRTRLANIVDMCEQESSMISGLMASLRN